MQLTLNLTFAPAQPRNLIRPRSWLDAGWATACIGFTKKVEISHALSDALHHGGDDDNDQHLYNALWLAHHHLALTQRPSLSFPFDFLTNDKVKGRFLEHSLRLHVEDRGQVILLGLVNDFQESFDTR